jgi:hypothetical protein
MRQFSHYFAQAIGDTVNVLTDPRPLARLKAAVYGGKPPPFRLE